MNSGDVAYNTVDSLSAFWPGLQVLAGDIQNAIKSHMMCENKKRLYETFSPTFVFADYNLWRTHSGLPEVYDTHFQQATSHQYPLRPGVSLSLNVYNSILPFIRWQEFIESTWYLYRVRVPLTVSVRRLDIRMNRPPAMTSTSMWANVFYSISQLEPG